MLGLVAVMVASCGAPSAAPAPTSAVAAKPVGATVRPVTTTATFTPAKKGVYRWFCSLPCYKRQAMWAMSRGYSGPSQEGFMAGSIVVI